MVFRIIIQLQNCNVEMSKLKTLFIYVGPGNPAPHGSWVYSKHTPKCLKNWKNILWRLRFTLQIYFQNWLYKTILPLLELAIVAAIASCVASVTTDTWNGVVQSEKKIDTVFPHIIAAATILFWNFQTLKISNSILIIFSLM